jgi:hypothetical protein
MLHLPSGWKSVYPEFNEFIFALFNNAFSITRSVWKVRGLALLLRVGNLWRCGDGLEVPPPLASDALLTTLHPLLENVLQTVDHFEISCIGAPFSWFEKPRNRMGRDLDCMLDVLSRTQKSIQTSPHAISGPSQPWKGSSEARNFKATNGLQHVFEKWVERYKKCIACQGRYFEKETVTAPPQSSDSQ